VKEYNDLKDKRKMMKDMSELLKDYSDEEREIIIRTGRYIYEKHLRENDNMWSMMRLNLESIWHSLS
jgi:hypothetical protein